MKNKECEMFRYFLPEAIAMCPKHRLLLKSLQFMGKISK